MATATISERPTISNDALVGSALPEASCPAIIAPNPSQPKCVWDHRPAAAKLRRTSSGIGSLCLLHPPTGEASCALARATVLSLQHSWGDEECAQLWLWCRR